MGGPQAHGPGDHRIMKTTVNKSHWWVWNFQTAFYSVPLLIWADSYGSVHIYGIFISQMKDGVEKKENHKERC